MFVTWKRNFTGPNSAHSRHNKAMYEKVDLTWASSSFPGLIETTQRLSQESAPSCNMYTVTKDLLFFSYTSDFYCSEVGNFSDATGTFCTSPELFLHILTGRKNLPVSGARLSPLLEKKHHSPPSSEFQAMAMKNSTSGRRNPPSRLFTV
jgi:hypothetical protein